MEICSFVLIAFVCHLCLASCVMDDMTTAQQASHFLIDHRGRIYTAGWPLTLCCKPWEIGPEKVHYNSPRSIYFISTVSLTGGDDCGEVALSHTQEEPTLMLHSQYELMQSFASLCWIYIALLTLLHSLPYKCISSVHFITNAATFSYVHFKWHQIGRFQRANMCQASSTFLSVMLLLIYVLYFTIKHLLFLVR